jgi:hypothetical protein
MPQRQVSLNTVEFVTEPSEQYLSHCKTADLDLVLIDGITVRGPIPWRTAAHSPFASCTRELQVCDCEGQAGRAEPLGPAHAGGLLIFPDDDNVLEAQMTVATAPHSVMYRLEDR